jgi:hypothetical protein
MKAAKTASGRQQPKPGHSLLWFFFAEDVRLGPETAAFILANVLDLVVTVYLLRSGTFRESNPVGRWVLGHWGLPGMIRFKLGFCGLVCIASQVIVRRHERLARWVLGAGTALAFGVALFGLTLGLRAWAGA